ncbi:MAG TPA: hypothetical protein VGD24_00430 [Gallionella sp.]
MKKNMALVHKILIIAIAVITVRPAVADETQYPYSIRKGEITVFGHTLNSKEIRSTEEDQNYVSFIESPNKQRILILYDEPFERGAAWLYDKTTKTTPQPVGTVRLGRHFSAEWYGDNVFAIFGTGMGYKLSRLFRIEQLNRYKEVNDIVEYDPKRDIYASLLRDSEFKYFIVVGRAFHFEEKEERFPVQMNDEDLVTADTGGYINNLEFSRRGFSISYENKKSKEVTETFQTRIIENAKP